MTPSELKYNVEQAGHEPYFFNYRTMRFFGDTMANYGCRSNIVNGQDVWELWRKRPVKHGLQASHFFCKKTFKEVRENKNEFVNAGL